MDTKQGVGSGALLCAALAAAYLPSAYPAGARRAPSSGRVSPLLCGARAPPPLSSAAACFSNPSPPRRLPSLVYRCVVPFSPFPPTNLPP